MEQPAERLDELLLVITYGIADPISVPHARRMAVWLAATVEQGFQAGLEADGKRIFGPGTLATGQTPHDAIRSLATLLIARGCRAVVAGSDAWQEEHAGAEKG